MSSSPQRDPKQDLDTAHTEAAGAAAEATGLSSDRNNAGNAVERNNSSSLLKPGRSGDAGGGAHVTFGGVADEEDEESAANAEKRRRYANLRLQAGSGSFANNGSIYTNGSIQRNLSGLRGGAAGGTPADHPAPASSPLHMLYQSFANPVSDAQAIESAVRETLGQQPMWHWHPTESATAPPVIVHDGDDEQQAIAALSTGDELRGCVDPTAHYIFRNSIRAPRGERPKPYLYTGDTDKLELAAAAQAAVRQRHQGLQSSTSASSISECAFFHEPVEDPSRAAEGAAASSPPPLLSRSGQRARSATQPPDNVAAVGGGGQHLRTWEDAPTDSSLVSSPKSQPQDSHEPTAPHPRTPKLPTESNEGELEINNYNNNNNRAGDAAGGISHTPSAAAGAPVPPVLTSEEEVPKDPANRVNCTYLCTGAFHAEPISEADIGKEELIIDTFNALPSEQRRRELLEAFYVAHMQPYEQNASYTADDWDDMTQTKVSRWFGVEFDKRRGCFFVTLFKRRVRVFLFSFLFRAFCLFLFWVIMFCLVPKNYFYPGGLYFDTLDTIVFAGIAGTIVARILTIPSIVGVIWAGILWNNVPYTTRLTAGITMDMRQFIGMFGLTIGLIRAGLSLNVIRFKQKFKHYITFSLLPMSTEMVVHGVCCKYIYKYPNFRWAFAEGFLLSSIAPSVVVPVIISFQRRGYGVRDGPSMMMLCSIAVDTAACVWGIEFLLALEFHKMSTALLIVLAPIQVLVGAVGGVILGTLVFVVTFYILFMEGERLPSVRTDRMMTLRHSVHVRYISIFFMVLVSFTGVAIGKRFSVLGGSAIGVVTIAGTFNYLCVRGGTADHLRVKADMAQTLTTVWDYIAMPSLFGLSGAAVNVHELFARDFIGQAFGLVFIGIGTRSLFAMLSPMITRLGLSWPEILFCGLGWIGKGSVQGALGPLAQTYASAELAAATTPEARAVAEERIEFGRKMKNTAVLGILVACPLCSIFLTRFTDRLLKPNT